jgi:hypothetical protein
MEKTELRAILEAAGTVGAVAHIDYEPFVLVIEHKKQTARGQYANVGKGYMGFDGRVAMARRDHAAQKAKLSIRTSVEGETEALVRVQAVVESELYGTVSAFAESRRDANGPEGQHPLEVAESSAVGRALGMLGYGILPGSGLASAEDVQRAVEQEADQGQRSSRQRPADQAVTVSPQQVAYLVKTYAARYQLEPEAARQQLNEDCNDRYGHGLASLTVEEGRTLSLELRPQQSEGTQTAPAQPATAAPVQGTGYLIDKTNFNAVVGQLNRERLSSDPVGKVGEWREVGFGPAEVEMAIAELRAEKWRRRFHGRLHDLGIDHERAKALLQVESLSLLYGNDVEQVLHTLEDLLKMQQTA